MPLMGTSVDWTQPRKESFSLKIGQRHFPDWNVKIKNKNKKEQSI